MFSIEPEHGRLVGCPRLLKRTSRALKWGLRSTTALEQATARPSPFFSYPDHITAMKSTISPSWKPGQRQPRVDRPVLGVLPNRAVRGRCARDEKYLGNAHRLRHAVHIVINKNTTCPQFAACASATYACGGAPCRQASCDMCD